MSCFPAKTIDKVWDLKHVFDALAIITAPVQSTTEGYVFTSVCLLRRGSGCRMVTGPRSFPGEGGPVSGPVPSPVKGKGVPQPAQDGTPWLGQGYPTPPHQDRKDSHKGYPHTPQPGQGYPLSQDGVPLLGHKSEYCYIEAVSLLHSRRRTFLLSQSNGVYEKVTSSKKKYQLNGSKELHSW